MEKEFYSVTEFAKRLSTTRQTIIKMIKEERIYAIRMTDCKKSPYRIPGHQLQVLTAKSNPKQFQNEE